MPDPAAVLVRRLTPQDDRSSFNSGDIDLDRFFKRYAGQNQFKHYIGTTYVVERQGAIIGFVTVSSGDITTEALPSTARKRLPDYPLPVLRIARLAVAKEAQGLGVGKLLLKAIFKLALTQRDQSGCCGVLVDAKVDAIAFYERLSFIRLESLSGELGDRPQPTPMFLSIKAIEKANNAS